MLLFLLTLVFNSTNLPFESPKASFFSESASEGLRGLCGGRHNKQAGRTVLRVTISRFLLTPPTTTHIQTSKLKKILSIRMP